MVTRREFFVGAAGVATALTTRTLSGQQGTFTPMDQGAYRPVMMDPKASAAPSMSVDERDQLERELKCQCTCVLDVFTCRTTDFTCSVSPAMHRDVLRLVEGGYSAQEIKDAFIATYGEVVLTAPVKQGFNWAGYFAPAVVMATGGIVLTMMLKRWSNRAAPAPVVVMTEGRPAGATDDETARLQRALREED
jgi:cytochrome c-type biogenesis protein CcmH